MHTNVEVPTYYDLIWPTLRAAIRLGGSAQRDELDNAVIESEGYSEEQQQVLKGDGPQTLLLDRLIWARSYLKGMGLMTNPRRGVWTVTEMGDAAEDSDVRPLHDQYLAEVKARSQSRRQRRTAEGDSELTVADGPDEIQLTEPTTTEPARLTAADAVEDAWKDQLLDRLQAMDPTAFEYLAQRILREAGFSRVNVVGRSNDGGIDGLGVYQVSLLSFPVYFQCKRYKGSVGSSTIRDFRGAMAGRGDKGLLITTGSFTSEAQREAKRGGAQPIDLIDGDSLYDLLKELSLGVSTVQRVVEDVSIRPEFFDSLDERHGRKG